MTYQELDKLMGLNLQRLRVEAELTQEELADRLQVSSRVLQRWESGEKGIGKDVLLKLCNTLRVKTYEFHMNDKVTYITNARERNIVNRYREAKQLGVDDLMLGHCDTVVEWARKKQWPASEDIFVKDQEGMPATNKPVIRGSRIHESDEQ
jgi:transcriptional regulator with XRE-family HTH domain